MHRCPPPLPAKQGCLFSLVGTRWTEAQRSTPRQGAIYQGAASTLERAEDRLPGQAIGGAVGWWPFSGVYAARRERGCGADSVYSIRIFYMWTAVSVAASPEHVDVAARDPECGGLVLRPRAAALADEPPCGEPPLRLSGSAQEVGRGGGQMSRCLVRGGGGTM